MWLFQPRRPRKPTLPPLSCLLHREDKAELGHGWCGCPAPSAGSRPLRCCGSRAPTRNGQSRAVRWARRPPAAHRPLHRLPPNAPPSPAGAGSAPGGRRCGRSVTLKFPWEGNCGISLVAETHRHGRFLPALRSRHHTRSVPPFPQVPTDRLKARSLHDRPHQQHTSSARPQGPPSPGVRHRPPESHR